MELDKRIEALTDIQSVTDGCHDWEFMTKKGYFSNRIVDFKDLKKCAYGEYAGWREHDNCFLCEDTFDKTFGSDWYAYFIPEDALKPEEPKKKYKSFTLHEFLTAFPLLTDVTIREKGNNDCVLVCTVTAYRMRIISNDICLGVEWLSLKELFDKYEFKVNGEWKPFGVIDEDKE